MPTQTVAVCGRHGTTLTPHGTCGDCLADQDAADTAHNVNRLTDADRAQVAERIRETVAAWTGNGQRRRVLTADSDAASLYRIACHSIGCSDADLRQAEADEIHGLVVAAIETTRRKP